MAAASSTKPNGPSTASGKISIRMMAILINFVLFIVIGRKEKDQVNSTTYPNGESSQNVPKAALRFLGAQDLA